MIDRARVFDAYGLGTAIPVVATLRDPSARTIGTEIAREAVLLGRPFMPWQRYVADVAGELTPAGTLRYHLVVLSVPRQSGKTTLMMSTGIQRARMLKRSRIYYTAQTRHDAVQIWKDMCSDYVARVKGLPPGAGVEMKIGTGNERLIIPGGSTFSPFAPTVRSLHGRTSPLVIADECFAFDQAAGEALDAAIIATHVTVPGAQDIYLSTMGSAASVWWHSKIDEAIEMAGDPASGVAVFVWSADPELADSDPYGEATLAFHPAYGHTQTAESLRAAAGKASAGNWRRSFLNLRTQSTEAVISSEAWQGLATAQAPPSDNSRVPVALDVAADRSSATLTAAWPSQSGSGTDAGLVDTGPGYAWAIERAQDLARAGHPIVADDSGPTRTAVSQLRARGVDVTTTTPRQYATACQRLLDDVDAQRVHHDGAAVFTDQLAGLVLRPMGGATGFSPDKSAGPIDALRALALASWAAQDLTLTPALQVF